MSKSEAQIADSGVFDYQGFNKMIKSSAYYR